MATSSSTTPGSTTIGSRGAAITQAEVPNPTEIKLHRVSRVLEVSFADGNTFHLPCEYLRTHSPSAEVQQHGNPILVRGKEQVAITQIERVGQYAVRLHFSDGHNTGLFTWGNFYDLGSNQEANLANYQHRLAAAGPEISPQPATAGSAHKNVGGCKSAD